MNLLELAKEIGLEPRRVASTNGGEYASACPSCGGTKHFRIWPNQQAKNCIGTYWCRECEKRGDTIQFCRDFFGLEWKAAIEKAQASVPSTPFLLRPEKKSFVPPSIVPPNEQWINRAESFVNWAHKQVWNYPDKIRYLGDRGISQEAITCYRIGYCDQELRCHPSEFGVDKEEELFFRKGIVIPSIEPSGKVMRVKIRVDGWFHGAKFSKYQALPGSMNGLNIIGDVRKPTMIVVESELDAYALHHACEDLIFAVAVGSNTKNPDNYVDYLARRRSVLICYDNDDGGEKMLKKWAPLYKHAKAFPTPIGKDVGEAIQKGLNIRNWVLEGLNGLDFKEEE